jgi:hypothetical protein
MGDRSGQQLALVVPACSAAHRRRRAPGDDIGRCGKFGHRIGEHGDGSGAFAVLELPDPLGGHTTMGPHGPK